MPISAQNAIYLCQHNGLYGLKPNTLKLNLSSSVIHPHYPQTKIENNVKDADFIPIPSNISEFLQIGFNFLNDGNLDDYE